MVSRRTHPYPRASPTSPSAEFPIGSRSGKPNAHQRLSRANAVTRRARSPPASLGEIAAPRHVVTHPARPFRQRRLAAGANTAEPRQPAPAYELSAKQQADGNAVPNAMTGERRVSLCPFCPGCRLTVFRGSQVRALRPGSWRRGRLQYSPSGDECKDWECASAKEFPCAR